MEKLKRLVYRQSKPKAKSQPVDGEHFSSEHGLEDWKGLSVHSVDDLAITSHPSAPLKVQSFQDLLEAIEESYYSMTFDSGKYEIENSAGSYCRQLGKLKNRLQVLKNQYKAVSQRVSQLVLEKHPLYDAELKGVLLLQADNWDTLELCRRIRQSLKSSDDVLVLSRLTVIRNYRRCLRLRKSLNVLRHIRALQTGIQRLDSLLAKGTFCSAIEVHRESLVLLEDYRKYRCVEPIHLKLKALGSRIDDLLDTELEKSCEHFNEASYATVQLAFELLGSTQTMFAQLQMHYISAIQRRTSSVVQSYLTCSEEADEAAGSEITVNYAELCKRLTMEDLPSCLSDACQSLWLILLCYHRTTQWHQKRACSKRTGKRPTSPQTPSLTRKFCEPRDVAFDSVSSEEGTMVDADEEISQPQLIRQWHEYVASKLAASRNRIWIEVSGRIEPILKAMGQFVTELSFKQILSVLQTVNHFVKIGDSFSGARKSDLLEVLRTSIHKFFKEFHRKHLERLRIFLGNETWEFCPVKSTFTVLDLQEYRSLPNLFQSTDVNPSEVTTNGSDQRVNSQGANSMSFAAGSDPTIFDPPYNLLQFPVQLHNECTPKHNAICKSTVPTDSEDSSSPTSVTSPGATVNNHNGPLLSSTTLEVLRLIGRYLQMMCLLQPIAAEVMHSICQIFDYYLYSIFVFFGPLQTMDSSDIPDRLRLTLKRINDRLIAPDSHPAVAKGDRFPLPTQEPMHVFNSVNKLLETMLEPSTTPSITALCSSYLQAHFVGVESVICLADMLESMLLPRFSTCLPERKRGLTSVFREQAITAARQMREPCASQIASHLVSLLLTADTSSNAPDSASTSANGTIASSLGKIWSGNSTEKDAVSSRANRLVSAARTDTTNETNCITTAISSMLWTSKEVATTPSPYVHQLHTSVLSPFGRIMCTLTQRLGLCEAAKVTMWNALLTCIGTMLLNAYSQVHLCSEEGRGQMLLDVQSITALAETESKIRSFSTLDRLVEYVQAFYVPVHEWEHWLTHTGTKYSRAQLTGLAHCLARGDRRQRQRLLNTINQIYATSGVQTSTTISNTNT